MDGPSYRDVKTHLKLPLLVTKRHAAFVHQSSGGGSGSDWIMRVKEVSNGIRCEYENTS